VKGVPKETHVSRVEASPFDAGGAYVTFDGHRTDDHKPYVYVTKDFGETWSSISSNLPAGNVNVITADTRNRNLLFLGTEYAVYVSMDAGASWKRLMQGLPTVRIDDLVIHPRDRDLIVGTHGRSIWILDDISPLEQMTDETSMQDAALFDVRPARAYVNDIQKQITVGGAKNFRGANPEPGTLISYWLKGDATDAKVEISDVTGRVVRTFDAPKTAGLNRVRWTMQGNPQGRGAGGAQGAAGAAGAAGARGAAEGVEGPPGEAAQGGGRGGRGRGGFGAPPLPPGSYLVKLTVNGKAVGQKTITIEADSLD